MSSTTPFGLSKWQKFTVTHTFHPLKGKEYFLVNYTLCWSTARVFFYDANNQLKSFPASWTDIKGPDPFIELAAEGSPLHISYLLELVDLMEKIKEDSVN